MERRRCIPDEVRERAVRSVRRVDHPLICRSGTARRAKPARSALRFSTERRDRTASFWSSPLRTDRRIRSPAAARPGRTDRPIRGPLARLGPSLDGTSSQRDGRLIMRDGDVPWGAAPTMAEVLLDDGSVGVAGCSPAQRCVTRWPCPGSFRWPPAGRCRAPPTLGDVALGTLLGPSAGRRSQVGRSVVSREERGRLSWQASPHPLLPGAAPRCTGALRSRVRRFESCRGRCWICGVTRPYALGHRLARELPRMVRFRRASDL